MKSIYRKKRFFNRRNLLMALLVTALISCGTFYFINQSSSHDKKDQERAKTNKRGGGKANAEAKRKTSSDNSGNGLPENSESTTSDQVPNSSSLSVNITSASQSGGLVRASAQTNSGGTCVFLYKPGDNGKPVTRQVDVASNNCSVSISQNEFSYLGHWDLTVTYYSGSKKAEAGQNVTIN